MQSKVANALMRSATNKKAQLPKSTILKSFLASDETYATILFLIVMDKYGTECLEWAPETIRMEVEDDFGVKLPKQSLDKLMAAITVITTNFFYQDPVRFVELCNIFSGDDAEPNEFDPADVDEIAWGLSEAFLLWPPENSDNDYDTKFSAEVLEYIRQTLIEEGFLTAPDVLNVSGLDETSFVRDTWSSDPEMYHAIYELQEEKKIEIKQFLLDNFTDLKNQLKVVPLEDANKEELLDRLERSQQAADK
jgi:hypothetical protein